MYEPATDTLQLIDTHAHLSFEDYDADMAQVVERAGAAGLVGIVSIGIEPTEWDKTIQLAREFVGVYPALGIHPNSADQATPEALADLYHRCQTNEAGKVVALGETGLDYYRQYVPHEAQKKSFRAHLDMARELDLPVIIHNRDAHDDLLQVLRSDGVGTRGVMHSFSGDEQFARECLNLGYLISLAGPLTFKKAVDKHRIATSVPLEMLLVETDCPFLTPEPFRGRRNEPAYVAYTARALAQWRGISPEAVAAQTTHNACKLFGLVPTRLNAANEALRVE